ncbi:hypothetical protein B0H14DRAFT_2604679 [Mycena olivaceomarginata]|nr:hypothetical protein B0H14DRAFT_2604679 [Mycena olivaceomarginata]
MSDGVLVDVSSVGPRRRTCDDAGKDGEQEVGAPMPMACDEMSGDDCQATNTATAVGLACSLDTNVVQNNQPSMCLAIVRRIFGSPVRETRDEVNSRELAVNGGNSVVPRNRRDKPLGPSQTSSALLLPLPCSVRFQLGKEIKCTNSVEKWSSPSLNPTMSWVNPTAFKSGNKVELAALQHQKSTSKHIERIYNKIGNRGEFKTPATQGKFKVDGPQ